MDQSTTSPSRTTEDARPRRAPRLIAMLVVPLLVGLAAWRFWPDVVSASWSENEVLSALSECRDPVAVRVTTVPPMRDAVEKVAGSIEDRACASFSVSAEQSAVTLARVEKDRSAAPAVWVPDSVALATQVVEDVDGLSVAEPVASTPVVIAVPEGLQAPDPATWGSTIVSPETRLPDPTESTVGSLTMTLGLGEIQTLPAGERAAAMAGLGGMLSRMVPEESLLAVHSGTPEGSIFPTTEQQVHRSEVPGLTVVAATSPTPPLEFPLVTRDDAPVDAIEALTAALTSREGQETLRSMGFRTPTDPSPLVAGSPPALDPSATPDPKQVQAAEQIWRAIATPTRLLTVIDTSGSMKQPGAGGRPRIEVAAAASSGAFQLLADQDSVGLWSFSTLQRGSRDWTQIIPVQRLTEEGQRDQLAFALGSLGSRLGGDTGLYDTVYAGYRAMLKDYDKTSNNLMTVFTDGVNDDPAGGLSLAQLAARLKKVADPDKPVTVLFIELGGQGSKALEPIAKVIPRAEGGGGGVVFAIAEPQDIADVYVGMILRRLPQ